MTPAQPARSAPPAGPQPVTLPAEQFPSRLNQLDFSAYRALDGAEYILPPVCNVPAGAFLMGSDQKKDKDLYDNGKPQHSVTLAAYQIGKYPVTVAEYACFVRATSHTEPKSPYNQLTWAQQLLVRLDRPVVNVSWQDATAYAQWLAERTQQSWRLPSEAEWEKAARGADGRLYPWGDTFESARANTSEGKKGTTTPVGSYPNGASPYGVLDMAGNVWEWTSTVFKPYPYTASDGRERAELAENRVQRGGSWDNNATGARAACRVDSGPGSASGLEGFRLALAVPSS